MIALEAWKLWPAVPVVGLPRRSGSGSERRIAGRRRQSDRYSAQVPRSARSQRARPVSRSSAREMDHSLRHGAEAFRLAWNVHPTPNGAAGICTLLPTRVRVRSSTNASRGLNSRHDGQPYVDPTTTVDESRTMPRHKAGNSSSKNRTSTRIPISTAPSGSSGNTGSCISQTQEGNFRPRLLLASTRLSTGSTTRYQPGFLGQETRPEHPAGYRQRESAPTARVDNSRSLGVRNQAHGRAGAPHQRISRHEAIEIDRSGSKCNGSYPAYVISSRWR